MNTSGTLLTLITTREGSEVEKRVLYNDYQQVYLNIKWWINTIAYITIVGGLGNILTFMQKRSLKNVSVSFYTFILTLADKGK